MDDADTNTKNQGGKQEMKSVFTLLIYKVHLSSCPAALRKRQKVSLG